MVFRITEALASMSSGLILLSSARETEWEDAWHKTQRQEQKTNSEESCFIDCWNDIRSALDFCTTISLESQLRDSELRHSMLYQPPP